MFGYQYTHLHTHTYTFTCVTGRCCFCSNDSTARLLHGLWGVHKLAPTHAGMPTPAKTKLAITQPLPPVSPPCSNGLPAPATEIT